MTPTLQALQQARDALAPFLDMYELGSARLTVSLLVTEVRKGKEAIEAVEAAIAALSFPAAAPTLDARDRMSAAIRRHFPFSAGSSHDELIDDFLAAGAAAAPEGVKPEQQVSGDEQCQ